MQEIVKTISEYPIASGVFGLFIIMLADIVKVTILQGILIITSAWERNRQANQNEKETERQTCITRNTRSQN